MSKADDAHAAIEARARAWLIRMRSGRATQDDAEAFRAWCAESPAHASEVRQLSETWSALGDVMAELTAEDALEGRSSAAQFARQRRVRQGRRAFVGFAVAAGATWLAVRPPLQLWPALGDYAADFRTGTGEQRQVALSERVVVDMNTQTRINLLHAQTDPSTQHSIELVAGEAEIVAAAPGAGRVDPLRPVTVVAGPGRLQAQVARFDVRRVGDEVCVTCVSGSLTLEHPQRRMTLNANQQLVYDTRSVRPVEDVDINGVTAWRRGKLVFNGVPLQTVVDEINRYRPGKLILRNAQLRRMNVQAQFAIANLDDAIAMICKYSGAQATELPGKIVLLS
ncbi:anti-sigma factor VreR [Paraburkholderia jirisanensis]